DLRHLHNRKVRTLLPGLAENIALSPTGEEIRFKRIPRGNRRTGERPIYLCSIGLVARKELRYRKTGRLQGWKIEIVANRAGYCVLGRTTGSKRNDRIRHSVVDTVIDASDRAGIVDHAIGLPALKSYDTLNTTAVGYLTFHGRSREEFGELVVVVDIENVRAVKV